MTTTLTSANGILHLGVPVLGLRRRSDDCRPAVLLQSPIDHPEVVVVVLRAHRLVENRLSSAIRFCPAVEPETYFYHLTADAGIKRACERRWELAVVAQMNADAVRKTCCSDALVGEGLLFA